MTGWLKFLRQKALGPALALVLLSATQVFSDAGHIEFNRDIRPLLSENCFYCHGADPEHRKAKMRLDVSESAIEKGAIVPGKPEESKLVQRIFSSDPDEQMPPPNSNRHLSDEQKNLLRDWIKQGAKYDTHWAFKTPTRPALPKVKQKDWPRNPIDYFILARLEAENLKPSPEASPEKILRRASLDLTGLPPTPAQLKAWMQHKDPLAAAVDELLASPHFGERMASDWMDVARYADTHGFNNDSLRTMWRWRDWVIDAFNKNLPYDRFITEQLAGDLLKKPTLDQLIATGFNRNHVINSEGGIIDEEYRVEYVADRVRTTSLAWLGLTMECARCHDHKFDPITQKDYYRLFAFFNSVDELGEDGRTANASPFATTPTTKQQQEMAKHRAAMRAAEQKMKQLLATEYPANASFEKILDGLPATTVAPETNKVIALELAAWNPVQKAITNQAGGKPFRLEGKVDSIRGPLGKPAFIFDGESQLNTDALPGFHANQGWAFSAWIRRDAAEEGALFSTMDYRIPESSQSHGQGVEVRLTKAGAIEVRMARRWPAYAVNIISRETVPLGEWRKILVTCDGSEKARGLRLFIDGEECFWDAIHDNFASVNISGDALLGASEEKGAHKFTGVLADVRLLSRPIEPEKLASIEREAVIRYALETEKRSRYQADLLRRAWLQAKNSKFAAVENEWHQARSALLKIEREAPTTMVMRELSKPRQTHVLFRGQYDQPRDAIEPGVPEFLLPMPKSAPRNRLGLAQWFTDPRHPLTARVAVNRFWQSIFGSGIVKSAENFGNQADWPSHPELLDWLAREFSDKGWDVKKLVRLIVTSATYRQDSRSTQELNDRDPENRLLAHGPRQRLTAEMLRDQALSVSGLLHDEVGGAPVFPYQPPTLYRGVVVAADYPGTSYSDSTGNALYRRSLYTFWKRTVPHPTLATFDAPDREVCVARRLKTNTPLQALALMNDTVQLEAARKLAERMLIEAGDAVTDRVNFAFQLATARKPDESEQKAIGSLLEQRLAYYRADQEAAKRFLSIGASKPSAQLDMAELAAYANVASLILNLDETITRN